MKDKASTHVYGSADNDNRQPPPPEGMRGEGSPSGGAVQYARNAGGITIEETSGTAAAEVAARENDR